MADVQWIKFDVDMFDNEKIKYMRTLPDGDKLVLIWVMLLAKAGKCNAGGMICITEKVPCSLQYLADELKFPENTISLALQTMQKLDMIDIENDFILISDWEGHQSVDRLEQLKEQNRKRVAKHRQQKKLQCNVTETLQVMQSNGIDKEIDIEKDNDMILYNNITKGFDVPAVVEVMLYCADNYPLISIDAVDFVNSYTADKGHIKGVFYSDWKEAVDAWVEILWNYEVLK